MRIESYFYCRKFSSPSTWLHQFQSSELCTLQHMFAEESCRGTGLSLDLPRLIEVERCCIGSESQTTPILRRESFADQVKSRSEPPRNQHVVTGTQTCLKQAGLGNTHVYTCVGLPISHTYMRRHARGNIA